MLLPCQSNIRATVNLLYKNILYKNIHYIGIWRAVSLVLYVQLRISLYSIRIFLDNCFFFWWVFLILALRNKFLEAFPPYYSYLRPPYLFLGDRATMRSLNPPFSTPGPVAEKTHRQAWSDAVRKQVCEYAEARHKLHGTRPP